MFVQRYGGREWERLRTPLELGVGAACLWVHDGDVDRNVPPLVADTCTAMTLTKGGAQVAIRRAHAIQCTSPNTGWDLWTTIP